MKINELLDTVKNTNGLNSDGELARKLDVDKRRISDYRHGRQAPDEFTCLKIAEALGKPLNTIIATVKACSEKDEKRREVWENYFKRIGGLAASLASVFLVFVTLIVTSPKAEAASLLALETVTYSDSLYYVKQWIKSKVQSGWRTLRAGCCQCSRDRPGYPHGETVGTSHFCPLSLAFSERWVRL